MAHFAKIENDIVVEILVVNDALENRGADFLANDLGLGGTWVQTSYNNNFRKQFAGVGYTYDWTNDIFIAPQPFASWVLDDNFDWQPPKPRPDGSNWFWDEEQGEWINAETV